MVVNIENNVVGYISLEVPFHGEQYWDRQAKKLHLPGINGIKDMNVKLRGIWKIALIVTTIIYPRIGPKFTLIFYGKISV
jgi:hypothetical protein